jgi:iron complex transport system substrate-binding protein
MAVSNLTAVEQNQMFGIWHHFYSSPFNVTALAALAKWLHPHTFHDLDPDALLADFYREFQPVPFQGTYWVSMDAVDEPPVPAAADKATP